MTGAEPSRTGSDDGRSAGRRRTASPDSGGSADVAPSALSASPASSANAGPQSTAATRANVSSNAGDLLTKFDGDYRTADQTPAQLVECLEAWGRQATEEASPLLQVILDGELPPPVFLPRLDADVQLQIEGHVGHHAFCHGRSYEARVFGDADDALGESLEGAVIKLRGDAKGFVGAAMTSGTIAVYGSAGDDVGAGMNGGQIFIRGDVGCRCGFASRGGLIVVGGNAGSDLGREAESVTFYLRGDYDSLADGMVATPLRRGEQLKLAVVLMNSSIRGEVTEFRRVVSRDTLEAERQRRGEIGSSWR